MAADQPPHVENLARIGNLLRETGGTGNREDARATSPEPEPTEREEPTQETPPAETTPTESESPEVPAEEAEPKSEPGVEGEDVEAQGEIPVYSFQVDGKDVEVGLDELVRHYQKGTGLESASHRKLADLNREKANFELERSQLREQVTSQVQKLEQVYKSLAEEVQAEPERLEALRKSGDISTEEYWTRKAEMLERQEKLQRAALEAQQAIERERQVREPYERANLLRLVPEWTDEVKQREESAEVERTILQDYGIPLEVARNLAGDHRFIAMAVHASRYKRLIQSKSDVVKKVRTLPKVVKPGAPKENQVPMKHRAAREAHLKLKKTGSKADAVKFFEHVLKSQREAKTQRGRPV